MYKRQALGGVIETTTGASGATGTVTSSPQAPSAVNAPRLKATSAFFREKSCINPPLTRSWRYLLAPGRDTHRKRTAGKNRADLDAVFIKSSRSVTEHVPGSGRLAFTSCKGSMPAQHLRKPYTRDVDSKCPARGTTTVLDTSCILPCITAAN